METAQPIPPPQPQINPAPPNPNPPPTPTIIQPAKPKSSPIKIIILILVVLILGIIVGKYLNITQLISPQPKACTMDAKLCPDGTSVGRVAPNCDFAPCPTPQPTPDPTAGWKIYTNTAYNYSFKYPPTWKTEAQAAGALGNEASLDALMLNLVEISTSKNYPDTAIQITDLEPTYSEEGLKTNVIINSINYVKRITKQEPDLYTDSYITKTPQNKYLEILFSYDPNGSTLQVFTQILSTFKFLDESESTPGWKNYTDKKYNFSFKYPIDWEFKLWYPTEQDTNMSNKSEEELLKYPRRIDLRTYTGDDYFSMIGIDFEGAGDCINPVYSKASETYLNGIKVTLNYFVNNIGNEVYCYTNFNLKNIPNLKISLNYPAEDKEVVNQIVSSFKFTE